VSRPFYVDRYFVDSAAPREVVAQCLGQAWNANKIRAKQPIEELPDGYRFRSNRLRMLLDLVVQIQPKGERCYVWGRILRADVWQDKLFIVIPFGTRHSYGAKVTSTVMRTFVEKLQEAGYDTDVRTEKVALGTERYSPE
jgi:hypothetical protein